MLGLVLAWFNIVMSASVVWLSRSPIFSPLSFDSFIMLERAEAAPLLEEFPPVWLYSFSAFNMEKRLPANSGGMIDYLLRVLLKAATFYFWSVALTYLSIFKIEPAIMLGWEFSSVSSLSFGQSSIGGVYLVEMWIWADFYPLYVMSNHWLS